MRRSAIELRALVFIVGAEGIEELPEGIKGRRFSTLHITNKFAIPKGKQIYCGCGRNRTFDLILIRNAFYH
jgi:hypothetical protein